MRRAWVVAALVVAVAAVGIGVGYWVRGPSAAIPVAGAGSQGLVPASRIGLPNPGLTPGAVNPLVTSETLADTICLPGWTKTVRPPSAYTSALKLAQIVEYGYPDKNPKHYQEDHLVPLELGGAPRDPRNLWPQPLTASLPDGTSIGADEKDDLEDALKHTVCDGSMDLGDAQRAMADDWVSAWVDAGRP